MGQVALAKGHKEPDPLDAGNVLCQGLDLFVVQQVHVLVAYLVKIVLPLDGHGRNFHPVAIFPVGTRSRHFPQVDLRVEVGGKGIAVISPVAVQNVDGVDLIEQVLLGIGAIGLGDAGIKPGTQQRGEAGLFKLFFVSPLPGVVKVGGEAFFLAALLVDCPPARIGDVLGLIVGGVQIIDAAFQAGIHNSQILVGQGNIHHQIGLVLPNQGSHLGSIVGIHLSSGDFRGGFSFQIGFQGIALGLGSGSDADFRKDFTVLAALADGHVGHTAAADDKNFVIGNVFSFIM